MYNFDEKSNQFSSWEPVDYIQQRVKQYQSWYDRKAVTAKSYYLRMRTIIVISGVFLPVVVNSSIIPWKDGISSVISLIVAGGVALENVYHFREQWKNYRSTEQFLSREQVLFLTGEGGYKDIKCAQAAFIYFVERCESAIEAENASTLNIMTLAPQESMQNRPEPNTEKR